jgi:S1-C subfamily serine protease
MLTLLILASTAFSTDYIQSASGIDFSSTEIAGTDTAYVSCVRITCYDRLVSGTAFLHSSGCFITAAHVVSGSSPDSVFILLPDGTGVPIRSISVSNDLDLAVVYPARVVTGPSLAIAEEDTLEIGSQVVTWGFPAGYNGLYPMLTVGYLSGIDIININAYGIKKWVINAAFNSGNSGGPLVNVNSGEVIGVVSSKVAPLPRYIEEALDVLSNDTHGMQHNCLSANGNIVSVTEGQLVEEILSYLRSQTQLVIGHAVMLDDLRSFLTEQGIQP